MKRMKKKKKHFLEVNIPESNIFIPQDKKPVNLKLNQLNQDSNSPHLHYPEPLNQAKKSPILFNPIPIHPIHTTTPIQF